MKRRLAAALVALAALLATGTPSAWGVCPRLVGATEPGLSSFPTAEVVRVFWPGAPKTLSGSAISPSKVLIVSFRTMPTAAAWHAVLADWQHTGRRIWWVYRHEADLPSDPITPAQYHQRYTMLLADQLAQSGNVNGMSIFTGQSVAEGYVSQWYVPAVRAVGTDVYYLTNVPKVVAWAHAVGKPLAIPEFGNGTDYVNTGATDDQDVVFAKAYIAGLDSNVFAACWDSHMHNDLSRLPKTAAYLRSLT